MVVDALNIPALGRQRHDTGILWYLLRAISKPFSALSLAWGTSIPENLATNKPPRDSTFHVVLKDSNN